jgi:hypothetical protein
MYIDKNEVNEQLSIAMTRFKDSHRSVEISMNEVSQTFSDVHGKLATEKKGSFDHYSTCIRPHSSLPLRCAQAPS